MWQHLLPVFILFSYCGLVLTYKAAVFEYYPESADTAANTILKNLDRYKEFADKARSQSVNIVVFPEYGLTTAVSDPEEYAIDLDDHDHHVIKSLSALASERQIYLVVNLLEKNSNNGQTKYHNTNLVFDKNGNITTIYRKINLYNETKLTPGPSVQNQTFTTDFEVTFGIFTCFDILFYNPSRKVLEGTNVTDIVFPTAWVSKMPFYISLSVQHGYAIANGVNLLAANYDTPKEGRGGSGIYLADGKIVETYIADTPSSKPIIGEVKKIITREPTDNCASVQQYGLPGDSTKSNVSDFITKKALNFSEYQFESVDLKTNASSTTVCAKDDSPFCCTFDISIDTDQATTDVYKLAVFDGEVDFDKVRTHIRVCSLLACEGESESTCGARINATAVFKRITISGNLPKDNTSFYTPLTVNTYLLPSTRISFCDTNNGTNASFVQLKTEGAHKDVLVFGLFGRTDLPRTPKGENTGDDSGSSAAETGVRFILLLTTITLVLY